MFANIERHIRNIFIGNVPKIPEEKRKQYISPCRYGSNNSSWHPELIGEALKFGLGFIYFFKR